ncbi:trifunctional dihydropteroate synthetase, partial [Elasticomyces elasticus]
MLAGWHVTNGAMARRYVGVGEGPPDRPVSGRRADTEADKGMVYDGAPVPHTERTKSSDHRAFVALGSNVGNRLGMIERACLEMNTEAGVRVVRTSGLYETTPMYYEDQDPFLNGACEIETSLAPTELLDVLQDIERRLGREKLVEKGPRCIDLDILLYDDKRVSSNRLTVPHASLLEREFVLRPLCDLIPNRVVPSFQSQGSVSEHLDLVSTRSPVMSTAVEVCPVQPPIRAMDPKRCTRVMSILNVTPDSFSDGGKNLTSDQAVLGATIKEQIAAGATIIDIGGQSSRPHAPSISPGEELSRILPAIRAIKSLPEAENVAISIDTYRAAVAAAAFDAGAHIINDISAGTLDPDMLPTMAELGCTVCLMHMRGTPDTMTSKENCTYPNGLIPTIAHELLDRV